jgi:phosphoadenosine phosphosulfate reductase
MNEVLIKESQDILIEQIEKFKNNITFACSYGPEDVVLIDLLYSSNIKCNIFAIDTGRLPEETLKCAEDVKEKYKIVVDWYFPQTKSVEKLERDKGFFSFRKSLENRKNCCAVRKLDPLKRALKNKLAWITGIRAAQTVSRVKTLKIEVDDLNGGIAKVNPLLDWSRKDVWDYIKINQVPYNILHDRNYASIGCAPCTRAIKEGEDERAGRWWWEQPESKECGLHHR